MKDWLVWDKKYRTERCTSSIKHKLAKDFINSYHSYIKWADRPSRKLYWLLYENTNLIGVFGLGSAFAAPKLISDFMKQNKIGFNELGNNIVFCLHGTDNKNAGTIFLKLIRYDAKLWWQSKYKNSLKAIQTFILPPRTGAVYKADNWKLLGNTTGGKTMKVRTIKRSDIGNYSKLEKRIFKSGEIKYLLREWGESVPKLMFIKLL